MFSAYGNFTTPPMFDSSAASRLPAMDWQKKPPSARIMLPVYIDSSTDKPIFALIVILPVGSHKA
jgi:hypothetical protein